MLGELTVNELKKNPLIMSISENAAYYGVVAAVVEYQIDKNKADSGYYIVAGLGKFPEYNNPKEIENTQNRNVHLFHPKQFAMQLNKDNIQYAIEELYNYCQRAEVLEVLCNEYDCEVPDVLRNEEFINLYQLNYNYNNENYDVFYRRLCKDGIDEFFKHEKQAKKSKSVRAKLDFQRSDRFDYNKSKAQKVISALMNKKEQIIPLSLLKNCTGELSRIEITEEEFQALKEALKDFPEVTYSIDDKTVIDTGEVKTKNPADNPFYGEQTHFEYRNIIFKKIDEPIIMGQLYKIEWQNKGPIHRANFIGDVTAKYVSYNNIENFVSLATANGLKFAIDYKGEFKKPLKDFVPVLFNTDKMYKYNDIMNRINHDKVNYHAIGEMNLPYLTDAIERIQGKYVIQPNEKARAIEAIEL